MLLLRLPVTLDKSHRALSQFFLNPKKRKLKYCDEGGNGRENPRWSTHFEKLYNKQPYFLPSNSHAQFVLPLSHTLPTKHFLWWVSHFFTPRATTEALGLPSGLPGRHRAFCRCRSALDSCKTKIICFLNTAQKSTGLWYSVIIIQ